MDDSSSAYSRSGPGCPPHLREHLERLVNSFPKDWWASPETGEQFPSLAEAERRLTAYALVKGFAFVRAGGGSRKIPGCNFKCIHHGEQTRNFRKLEDHVIRDKEGQIVSQRKREATAVRQTGCT